MDDGEHDAGQNGPDALPLKDPRLWVFRVSGFGFRV